MLFHHIKDSWSFSLENKTAFRKTLREKRQAIHASEREAAANAAAQLLMASDVFQSSQHIACYLANPNEFDAHPIIQAIWQANKNCYLPVLSQDTPSHLHFMSYHPEDALKPNRYHILEPATHAPPFPTDHLDLVLVPLVGFDYQGHRLGMGGGYYDRTFAFLLPQTTHSKKPCLIGLGYQVQQVESLPIDPWDISLNGVLTEQEFRLF